MRRPPRGAVSVNDRRRQLAVLAAGLAFLAAAGVARAGTATIQDADDVVGTLDIRSASEGHAGKKLVHTIRTFANWPISLLRPGTPNYFLLEISTDADPAPERSILIYSRSHHMVAAVFGPNGRFIARTGASRPNRHSVKVKIKPKLLHHPAGYWWKAFAFFKSPAPCRHGCLDRAPDGAGRVRNDIRRPTISFPQPPAPAGLTYDLDFTVADAGGSGLAVWRLEHRDPGPGQPWTLVVPEGLTPGPQSIPFTAAAPGDLDEFRVVALDGDGNRRISPVRQVTAGPP